MAAIRFLFFAARSSVALLLMELSSCLDVANIFIPVRVKVCSLSLSPVPRHFILSKQINSISSVIFAAELADGMNEWRKKSRFSSNLPLISSLRFSPGAFAHIFFFFVVLWARVCSDCMHTNMATPFVRFYLSNPIKIQLIRFSQLKNPVSHLRKNIMKLDSSLLFVCRIKGAAREQERGRETLNT